MFTFSRIKEIKVVSYLTAPQYAFIEEIEGELYVFPCLKAGSYQPLEYPVILTDFLSIGAAEKEEEAIKRVWKFVGRWGALGHALYGAPYSQMFIELMGDESTMSGEVYISCSSLASRIPFKTAGLILNLAGVAARRTAYQQGVILRKDSQIYKEPLYAVVGESTKVASELDKALEGMSTIEVFENVTPFDIEGDFYIFMGEKVEDIISRSKRLLQALEIYGQDQSIKPYVVISEALSWITKASKFRLSGLSREIEFRIDSLWSAIGFILLKLLHDNRANLTVCPHCKRVFIPSRNNQKFCSSSCRNRYTAKISYQRRKGKASQEG